MAFNALSKRKPVTAVPNDTKKKKRLQQGNGNLIEDESVFADCLSAAGASLFTDGSPVEIANEPALFQRSVQQYLKRHLEFPQVIEEFISGMSKQIDQGKRLYSFLLPTVVKGAAGDALQTGVRDSVVRLLLNIDMLQPKIVMLLLEKLVEISVSDETSPLPRLILNQCRWLNRIVESKEFIEKMFEVLTVVPFDIKCEIISCIPEVVDDQQHINTATQLKELMTQDSQLIVPILDALSNINLSQDLLIMVRSLVVQTLQSADIDDLPVIVRFLLQTASASDAYQVVCDIRENIDLSTIQPGTTAVSTKRKDTVGGIKDARGSEMLLLDSIRSGIRFQKFIAEAALKALESIKTSSDFRVIDVILLLILHSCGYKKQVESLCRAKITNGFLTEPLLQTVFHSHADVMKENFGAVLLLAEVLLRSSHPVVAQFACAVYRHAFVAFDAYCQQEVVGNLVCHIGSGLAAEIDLSLDILLDLVNNHVQLMSPFAVLIKSILDYLDSLNMSQIRKLYAILCRLAFSQQSGDSMIQDAMYIIVRKQLSNNLPRYQQMGVIGAVMIIRNLADVSCTALQDDLSDEAYQQAVSLLQLVKSSCNRSPTSNAMFMDELAVAVKQGLIHHKIEEWLSENVINDFQDDYVVDVVPGETQGEGDLPWSIQFGIDELTEGSIGVNLLPLVLPSRQLMASQVGTSLQRIVSAWCLASNFRLLQNCERRQHGESLDGIDALLGCPIKLPRLKEILDKLGCLSSKEYEILCDSIFLTINWFHELLNAFGSQREPEMKAKVITRLCNVVELHQFLEKILPGCPGYVPPPANFDVSDINKPILLSSSKKTVKRKKKVEKKAKGKKKDAEDDDDDHSDTDDDDSRDNSRNESKNDKRESTGSVETSNVAEPAASISSSVLALYVRELDFEVFDILQVGLITRLALDTNMNTKETETLQIQLPQLKFLLEDLVKKLEHILISSPSKRRSFLKPKLEKVVGFQQLEQLGAQRVAEKTIDLLPALCQHLESTSAYFQALMEANDGLLDGPGFASAESQSMAACLHLLVRALNALFAWNNLSLAGNRDLLHKALGVLANRLSTSTDSQLTFNVAVRQAFNYVENFSASIPTLPCAVSLCRLLSCLSPIADFEEIDGRIGDLALSFLKRQWYDPNGQIDKGSAHNEQLNALLLMTFSHSNDIQGTLDSFINVAVNELKQSEKDECSVAYPCLTRRTYPVFYRTLLQELVELVKSIPVGKSTDHLEDNIDKLVRWNIAVRTFHALVSLIKEFDASSNLAALIKNGRLFVDTFIQHAMPMLDRMFRAHRDDIQSLLKNLQLSTRALHHICGHSKIIKNVALTNQVPLLKRTLEGFVYRVKAMLTINNCLEAFWLGNLKNRDLKGDEIVSQRSQVETAQTSSEDSLPEDESSDDEPRVAVKKGKTKRTIHDDDSDEDDDSANVGLQSYSETF